MVIRSHESIQRAAALNRTIMHKGQVDAACPTQELQGSGGSFRTCLSQPGFAASLGIPDMNPHA